MCILYILYIYNIIVYIYIYAPPSLLVQVSRKECYQAVASSAGTLVLVDLSIVQVVVYRAHVIPLFYRVYIHMYIHT